MNLRGKNRRLIDHALPTTSALKQEGSSVGLLSVFLNLTTAEFRPLINSPADETFLKGLEGNLTRMASDLFLANFIPSYLTSTGVLTQTNEDKLRIEVVTIPEEIIPQLRQLSTNVLKGAFLLNKLAKGSDLPNSEAPSAAVGSRKRK